MHLLLLLASCTGSSPVPPPAACTVGTGPIWRRIAAEAHRGDALSLTYHGRDTTVVDLQTKVPARLFASERTGDFGNRHRLSLSECSDLNGDGLLDVRFLVWSTVDPTEETRRDLLGLPSGYYFAEATASVGIDGVVSVSPLVGGHTQ